MLIHWGSVKIKRKSPSSLEAETISTRSSMNDGIYLGHLLSECYYNDHQEKKSVLLLLIIDNWNKQLGLVKWYKHLNYFSTYEQYARVLNNKQDGDQAWLRGLGQDVWNNDIQMYMSLGQK